MSVPHNLDESRLPKHIAVIMDGNGRWAKKNGKARIFGHQNGVKSVRAVSEASAELGIEYLTLYAFSTENWNRPKLEVSALMELLVATIRHETKTLMENDIKLNAIGALDGLPQKCLNELNEAIAITSDNKRMVLTLALSYSGRWEIANMVKQISQKVKNGELHTESIDESVISQHLNTHNIPDPELLIRTSGEQRISNYLLWQIAYTELYFSKTLWPDFRKQQLYDAIADYQSRERRFGKISEQIKIK